jgi:hypothetical protein
MNCISGFRRRRGLGNPGRSILACLLFVTVYAITAEAQPSTCPGRSVLEELEGKDPQAFRRVSEAAQATVNANAVLWRIASGDKPPSYLFGTMHVTDERINALSPATKAALESARRIALEIDDVSQTRMAEAMLGAGKLMILPDGKRLDALLDADEFAKVHALMRRSGMPSEFVIRLRPWVAVMLLALSDCEKGRVANGAMPLDVRLARDAEARGVGVFGLETIERQFEAMAAVPESDQIGLLKATLKLYDRIDDLMETTVQLYLRRQLGSIWPLQLALAEKLGHPPQIFSRFEESVIVSRNLKMRDRVLQHLASGGIFIAVGALHLPGKQGLVELIREAGYTVTAIE